MTKTGRYKHQETKYHYRWELLVLYLVVLFFPFMAIVFKFTSMFRHTNSVDGWVIFGCMISTAAILISLLIYLLTVDNFITAKKKYNKKHIVTVKEKSLTNNDAQIYTDENKILFTSSGIYFNVEVGKKYKFMTDKNNGVGKYKLIPPT